MTFKQLSYLVEGSWFPDRWNVLLYLLVRCWSLSRIFKQFLYELPWICWFY